MAEFRPRSKPDSCINSVSTIAGANERWISGGAGPPRNCSRCRESVRVLSPHHRYPSHFFFLSRPSFDKQTEAWRVTFVTSLLFISFLSYYSLLAREFTFFLSLYGRDIPIVATSMIDSILILFEDLFVALLSRLSKGKGGIFKNTKKFGEDSDVPILNRTKQVSYRSKRFPRHSRFSSACSIIRSSLRRVSVSRTCTASSPRD